MREKEKINHVYIYIYIYIYIYPYEVVNVYGNICIEILFIRPQEVL